MKGDGPPTEDGVDVSPSRNPTSLSRRSSDISTHSSLQSGWIHADYKLPPRPEVEIAFEKPLDRNYECPVCCQVLRYPVQFESCGHRCCSSCLPELLRVAPRCPIDQAHVDRNKVYVDKAYQRAIDNLAVKCSYHERGCPWTGVLKDLHPHLAECVYIIVKCPQGCDVEFEKRFTEKHVAEDCNNRPIECEFCHDKLPYIQEIEHLNQCAMFPLPCPNGCKKKDILRKDIEEHMNNDCSKQTVPCPFADAGCTFRSERKEMKKHVKEEPEGHLKMINETLKKMKDQVEKNTVTLDTQVKQLAVIESRVDNLEKLYGAQIVWKIDGFTDKQREAIEGTKTTIYSPPFLTSRHGYKMVLSACLNGDGKAKGTHLSLFACICKGEYDPLLLWPFCHRLTFTLLDHCQDPAARRNITYSVKPNVVKENQPFLGRPTLDRNASFGAQRFVELSALKTLDYIRDDCMFITVAVDTDDMIML